MKQSDSTGSKNHGNIAHSNTVYPSAMQVNQKHGSHVHTSVSSGMPDPLHPSHIPWHNAVRFELAVEELAKDELALVERYVEDDIQRAAEYWSGLKSELSWWETQAGVYCLQAADPTSVQWLQLQLRWQASASIIMAGERLQDNSMCCLQCSQSYQVIGTVDVAVCANCGGEYFSCGQRAVAH